MALLALLAIPEPAEARAAAIARGVAWLRAIQDDETGAFVRAFKNSATVFIIIAAAGPFSWLLTSLGAIKELEVWLLSYTHNPLLFALVLCIFIYLLGMVMDSAANIIVLDNKIELPGVSIAFTPPASAILQSPLSRLLLAWLTATNELLLAVSIATLGPSNPNR